MYNIYIIHILYIVGRDESTTSDRITEKNE